MSSKRKNDCDSQHRVAELRGGGANWRPRDLLVGVKRLKVPNFQNNHMQWLRARLYASSPSFRLFSSLPVSRRRVPVFVRAAKLFGWLGAGFVCVSGLYAVSNVYQKRLPPGLAEPFQLVTPAPVLPLDVPAARLSFGMIAWGCDYDVKQALAVAVSLTDRGHSVVVYVPAAFARLAVSLCPALDVRVLDLGMQPIDIARAVESDGVLKDAGMNADAVMAQYFQLSTPALLQAATAISASCDVALIPYAPELTLVPLLVCREKRIPVVLLAHSPALVPMPSVLVDGSSVSASSVLKASMVSLMMGQAARAGFTAVYAALSLPEPPVLEALPFPSLWSYPMLLMYPTVLHSASALGAPAWFHQTGPPVIPHAPDEALEGARVVNC
jgi:hypothetical protein